jgi:hypothetical protein
LQGGGKEVNIILLGAQENCGIIDKKGSADHGCSSKYGVKLALFGGFSEDEMKWVNCQNE